MKPFKSFLVFLTTMLLLAAYNCSNITGGGDDDKSDQIQDIIYVLMYDSARVDAYSYRQLSIAHYNSDTIGTVVRISRHFYIRVKTKNGERYARQKEIKRVKINKEIATIQMGSGTIFGEKDVGYIEIKGVKMGYADVEVEMVNGIKWKLKLIVQLNITGYYSIFPDGKEVALYQIPSENTVYEKWHAFFKFVPPVSKNLDSIYPRPPGYSNYKIILKTDGFDVAIIINYYDPNVPTRIKKQIIYRKISDAW